MNLSDRLEIWQNNRLLPFQSQKKPVLLGQPVYLCSDLQNFLLLFGGIGGPVSVGLDFGFLWWGAILLMLCELLRRFWLREVE